MSIAQRIEHFNAKGNFYKTKNAPNRVLVARYFRYAKRFIALPLTSKLDALYGKNANLRTCVASAKSSRGTSANKKSTRLGNVVKLS